MYQTFDKTTQSMEFNEYEKANFLNIYFILFNNQKFNKKKFHKARYL